MESTDATNIAVLNVVQPEDRKARRSLPLVVGARDFYSFDGLEECNRFTSCLVDRWQPPATATDGETVNPWACLLVACCSRTAGVRRARCSELARSYGRRSRGGHRYFQGASEQLLTGGAVIRRVLARRIPVTAVSVIAAQE